ncbi:Hpt domain protein [Marinomonas spartinae]|uniref:Hpt domain protein n=1 Tax=Marinomonas spartinae TaxID=1792290 RepID=A0A1A8T0B3_9GAMM|nr:Hpt domain-containing protein [Marinomonas spartinae]SBS24958.1 Hpt domain protein [Marinomonas spartinae]SBS25224.1 Hpt domain protein [Marinomonas spartinae]
MSEIDQNALSSLITMLDKNMVNEVRLVFEQDCQEKMALLEFAWEQQDLATVAEICHALKSSSGNLALLSLSKDFEMLEKAARKAQTEHFPLPNNLNAIKAHVSRALNDLNVYFEQTH